LLIDEKTHLPEASSVLARPVATGGAFGGSAPPNFCAPQAFLCPEKLF